MTAFFRPTVLRDTLIARGASREEAERLSEALSAAFGEDVATRHDLEATRTELKAEIVAVRHDMDVAKTELRAEITATKSELRSEITAAKSELRSEVQALGAQLKDDMRALKLWIAIGALGLMGTAINLGAAAWRAIR